MTEKKHVSAEDIAAVCVAEAEDRKAENVITLKVTDLSVIADYFVLCTANSEPHLKAVTDKIEKTIKENYKLTAHREGTPASQWILLDYNTVLVHVMTPEARGRYQLESLWGDAPRVEAIKTLEKKSKAKTKKT
jgi:ribosome-associated protein